MDAITRALSQGRGAFAADRRTLEGYTGLKPTRLRGALQELVRTRRLEKVERGGRPPQYSLPGRMPTDRFGPVPDAPARFDDRKGGFVETQVDGTEVPTDNNKLCGPIVCIVCKGAFKVMMARPGAFEYRVKELAVHKESCPRAAFWIKGTDTIIHRVAPQGYGKANPLVVNEEVAIPLPPGTELRFVEWHLPPPDGSPSPKTSGRVAVRFSTKTAEEIVKGDSDGAARSASGRNLGRKTARRK